jgi:hypothetical protein
VKYWTEFYVSHAFWLFICFFYSERFRIRCCAFKKISLTYFPCICLFFIEILYCIIFNMHGYVCVRVCVFLGFVVPCIFKHSNETPNQMQQSIAKFIALSRRRCSTCFGHYYAHHQKPFQTAVAATGFRIHTETSGQFCGRIVVGLKLPEYNGKQHRNAYDQELISEWKNTVKCSTVGRKKNSAVFPYSVCCYFCSYVIFCNSLIPCITYVLISIYQWKY